MTLREPPALTEPPDESRWQLCMEAYEISGDFSEDARDWVSTTEHLDDDQIAMIEAWYRDSAECATRVEDRVDGEAGR